MLLTDFFLNFNKLIILFTAVLLISSLTCLPAYKLEALKSKLYKNHKFNK